MDGIRKFQTAFCTWNSLSWAISGREKDVMANFVLYFDIADLSNHSTVIMLQVVPGMLSWPMSLVHVVSHSSCVLILPFLWSTVDGH